MVEESTSSVPVPLLCLTSKICAEHYCPLASGAGIFLLLRDENKPLETTHLPAIGLFGFFITLGLFLHELRGMRRCWELVELGKSLEEQLELHQGQFTKEYSYYESRFRIVGTEAAS